MKKSYYQRFMAMTDAQRKAEVAEFDREDLRPGKPLSAAGRAKHERARGRGRPRKGAGAEIVSLSIEKELLRQAERLAKEQGLSRSELFSRGLRAVMAAAGAG